jgi:hypothetical protein
MLDRQKCNGGEPPFGRNSHGYGPLPRILDFYLANFRLQYGKVKSSTSLAVVRPIIGAHYGRLVIPQAVPSII